MIEPTRRQFLRLTAAGLAASGLARTSLTAFARAATHRRVTSASLVAAGDLALPPGFRYVKFGSFGDPMTDGNATPFLHDGMAAFGTPGGNIRLVRNQEIGEGNDIGPGTVLGQAVPATYDPLAPGGTVTLEWNPQSEQLVRSFVSLNGTDTNCAGGPTPWGTWLTCEETTVGTKAGYAKPHGYVFEVSAAANGVVGAQPLKAMGRFVHEAAAVDPVTGVVYLTEDQGPRDGFYRFVPTAYGQLQNGTLQILRHTFRQNYDTTRRQSVGEPLPVSWVTIQQPDPHNAENNPSAVFKEGHGKGAAEFIGNEGNAAMGPDGVYFAAGEGGDAKLGQIWQYVPTSAVGTPNEEGTLTLVYESSGFGDLDGPDNMTVSPRGRIILCEDGDEDPNFIRVLDPQTRTLSVFAENLVYFDLNQIDPQQFPPGSLTNSEFAGATFSPDGRWLFVNLQVPGSTYAITGDWASLGI